MLQSLHHWQLFHELHQKRQVISPPLRCYWWWRRRLCPQPGEDMTDVLRNGTLRIVSIAGSVCLIKHWYIADSAIRSLNGGG